MATTISIQVSTLTASRTFTNDTKARDALLRFYQAYSLGPPDATNQAKLLAVVDYLINYIQSVTIQNYVDGELVNVETTARTLYGFE